MSTADPDLPEAAAGTPRVSVIVPAYGVAHLVGEALESVAAQTMGDWECIVIDDGAPDDVASAVAPFLADARFRLMQTRNGGVSAARNRAIRASTAPLIALLDGDDLLRPDYLETMTAALEADPDARLVTCNARIFGAVARERVCVTARQGTGDGVRGSLSDVLDRTFNVYIGTTFRRSDFEAVGGFDEAMAQSEDLDLWVRLMMLGGHALYVNRVLGDYRVRPVSASSDAARMILGNIRVYEKAAAALAPGSAETALVARLVAQNRKVLDFEMAVDRIIGGEARRGLADLCRARDHVEGAGWRSAMLLWSVFPQLAAPMLEWRRRAHKRGSVFPKVT